jgi:hypothetical protein
LSCHPNHTRRSTVRCTLTARLETAPFLFAFNSS